MPSRLESKALQTVTDEKLQDFSQSSNKLGLGNNLMTTRKARMPLAMSDG